MGAIPQAQSKGLRNGAVDGRTTVHFNPRNRSMASGDRHATAQAVEPVDGSELSQPGSSFSAGQTSVKLL
jgi:hypothetical protein